MSSLIDIILEEAESDTESAFKRSRQLVRLYGTDPDFVDELMLALCGWTMKTLLDMEHREDA